MKFFSRGVTTTAKAERPPRGSWESRGVAALELLVVALLIALRWHRVIKNPSLFILLLGWIGLWLRRSSWRALGLRRPAGGWRVLGWCAGAAVAYDALDVWVILPLLRRFTGEPADLATFDALRGHLWLLVMWILVGWTIAAFVEELAYRGLVLDRFEELLGRGRAATFIAVMAVSAVFGLIHGYQGITGILDNMVAGVFFAVVYLSARRNLWASVVAHGTVNTISFLLLYLGVKVQG